MSHTLRALITVMRHHAESYESQAEGRSADDFEFFMDLSGLVTAWADALAEALEGRPAPPLNLQAIRLDAAMTALESMAAQGYFWHDAKGHALDYETTIRAITTALDTAMDRSRSTMPESARD